MSARITMRTLSRTFSTLAIFFAACVIAGAFPFSFWKSGGVGMACGTCDSNYPGPYTLVGLTNLSGCDADAGCGGANTEPFVVSVGCQASIPPDDFCWGQYQIGNAGQVVGPVGCGGWTISLPGYNTGLDVTTNLWTGQKNGSDPRGTYTRTGGCATTPATMVVQ